LVLHLIGRPYMKGWELLDSFETSGLVVCFAMMWSGIVFYSDDASLWIRELATVFLMLLNVCYVIFTSIVLFRQKSVEESPIVQKCGKLCFCLPVKWQRKIVNCIPVIHDGGKHWMTESEMVIETSHQQKKKSLNFQNPHYGHDYPAVGEIVGDNASANILASLELATIHQGILPDGWEAHRSEASGHVYYFHAETGASQWTVPK
jgi:hypothetical protein